ncbi:hypothetical protein O1V64_21890 [Rouxiella badensis]|nr:hypothetical protein O1V64_21890 [Rouxiella badensis]
MPVSILFNAGTVPIKLFLIERSIKNEYILLPSGNEFVETLRQILSQAVDKKQVTGNIRTCLFSGR